MEPPTAIITSVRKDIDRLADHATTAALRAKESKLIGDSAAPGEAEELNRYRTQVRILVAKYLLAMKAIGWTDAQISEHKASLRDSIEQAKVGQTEPAREVYAAALDQLRAST